MSELVPHLATCADDMAFLYAMVSKSNVHGPATFMQNTGFILPGFPNMGAWISYGLGSMNENLPALTYRKTLRPFISGRKKYFVIALFHKAVAKIEARLTRVEAGNLGVCEPVGEGVSELKIDYGPGYRVYFAEVGKVIIVLLGGGDKSTQSKDIKKARDLWEKYANDPERFQRDLRA